MIYNIHHRFPLSTFLYVNVIKMYHLTGIRQFYISQVLMKQMYREVIAVRSNSFHTDGHGESTMTWVGQTSETPLSVRVKVFNSTFNPWDIVK